MAKVIAKLSKLSEFGLFGFVCVTLGACAEGRANVTQETSAPQVSAVESALENPVAQCEEEQASCLSSAADRAAALQCSEAFRTCLGGAAEIGQQMVQAVEQCRATAAQCAVQGGAMGAEACRSEYDACVDAATGETTAPPPAAGAGGSEGSSQPQLPQLPAAGSGAPRLPTPGGPGLPGRRFPFAGAGGIGGLPTLPGRPRLPGAGSISLPSGGRGGLPLPGRTPRENSAACFEQLRTCAQAPNADLNQCATEARECVRGDSDPTTGAGGAGGSAGAP